MFIPRSFRGLAIAAALCGLVPTGSVEAASAKSQRFHALVTHGKVHATQASNATLLASLGLNEKGNLAALGRDAHGRTARQFDQFLAQYVRRHGLTAAVIPADLPLSRVGREQRFIINRFALAASFNSGDIAGGVFFGNSGTATAAASTSISASVYLGPNGTPITPVSPVNIFTFFGVFTQYPNLTGS